MDYKETNEYLIARLDETQCDLSDAVKERRFLASCLVVSIAVSFILLAFLARANGWW